MHVCVLGAGGLGSLIGARLAQSGVDVTLVGREAHVAAIRSNGLRVEGIRGPGVVHQHLEAVTGPAAVTRPIDYLLVTVKAGDTDPALVGADMLRGRARAGLSPQ